MKKALCRHGLHCGVPIEICYYSSELGRKDLCANCGSPEAMIPLELKKLYKTVLPICEECEGEGIQAVTQRPLPQGATPKI